MPECQVCSGVEFELFDGFYYCQKCNTQCTDYREEVEHNIISDPRTSLIVSRKRKRSDSQSLSSYRAATEQQKCLTSTELFNKLLAKQLDFLISFGVDRRIKDIVLTIWAKFLQMNELGYCGEYAKSAKRWRPRLYPIPRRCDVSLWKNLKKKKKLKKKVKRKKKDQIAPESEVGSAMSDSERPESGIYSETDLESLLNRATSELSYFSTEGELSQFEITSESEVEVLENTFKKKNQDRMIFSSAAKQEVAGLGIPTKEALNTKLKAHSVVRMTVARTVTFCYLGLCLLGDANRYVTLGDILRWIREGHLPYIDHIRELAKDLNLTYSELILFAGGINNISYKCPTADFVLSDIPPLVKYLNLSDVDPKVPVCFIQKFVLELHLPTSIIQLATDVTPKTVKKSQHGFMEISAIIRIIFVLKQLFILDGVTEEKISDYCEQLASSSPSSSQSTVNFSWRDWKRVTDMRCKLICEKHFSYWAINYPAGHPDFINIENSLKYFRLRGQQVMRIDASKGYYTADNKVFFLHEIQSQLQKAAQLKEKDQPQITVLPWRNYTKFYARQSAAEFSELLSLDFSTHSVNYIINHKKSSSRIFSRPWKYPPKRTKIIKDFKKFQRDMSDSFMWLLNLCSKVTEIPKEEILYHLSRFESSL